MSSNILFVLERYLPHKNAGIENYSHWLAKLLLSKGHTITAAIIEGNNMRRYDFEGIHVVPLKNGFASFQELLGTAAFDICHFQEYSGQNGINVNWFAFAKQHTKKVFFTFHLPYLTCYKFDFRYNGIDDCNNFSDPMRCENCVIATKLHYTKTNTLKNTAINVIKPLVRQISPLKKVRARIERNYSELSEVIANSTNIFIYANWFKVLMEANGFADAKIKKIPYINNVYEKNIATNETVKKRILFVGRIEHQKGLILLCKAMREIKTANIELDVFGNIVDQQYFDECIKTHPFNFKKTLPLKELLELLPAYDFLILPSMFTEMYSMMVKDAFYNQLPVIASAAKGNRDAITDAVNGFIFDYGNATSLANVMDKAYAMKYAGWKPAFVSSSNPDQDLAELSSYYTV